MLFSVLTVRTPAQFLLKVAPGEGVTLMPSDMAILETDSERKDLPCSVTPRKADLGFDLRFHSGYEVTIPMAELAGSGEVLTVLFRVYPEEDKGRAAYFVQHIQVPPLP
ncbi:MAG: hypothetical protein JO097_19930, partial [Acidobacteriaceae bacterium]|nr:hypothetical protein [Acidobacteriaceae bacterium]